MALVGDVITIADKDVDFMNNIITVSATTRNSGRTTI
jgi:hypothetical protein